MNYKQINIFDYSNKKEVILNNLKSYGIDELYKVNFNDESYTFYEIYRTLSKSENFSNYLIALSDELKKYIAESDNCHLDFCDNYSKSTFTRREDCIMIYNSNNRSVGPIYCAEMISKDLLESEEKNEC